MRVGSMMQLRTARTLKHYGVSAPTYDILSVLCETREPMPSHRIAGLIRTAVPDISRLIDRLESKGLVARRRSTADRRVVLVSITPGGRAVVEQARIPMDSLAKQVMGRLKKGERRDLIRLLAKLDAPLTEHV